jgi:hypothetical protein
MVCVPQFTSWPDYVLMFFIHNWAVKLVTMVSYRPLLPTLKIFCGRLHLENTISSSNEEENGDTQKLNKH